MPSYVDEGWQGQVKQQADEKSVKTQQPTETLHTTFLKISVKKNNMKYKSCLNDSK